MNHSVIRLGALAVLMVFSAACGGTDRPTAPTVSTARPPVVMGPSGPTGFPPVVRPARIFTFNRALSYPVREFTVNSRYVLYDDGSFALQYSSIGGEYLGTYQDTNGVLTFRWQGWSIAGPWGATGSLQGDSLAVKYNDIMTLSDFEDAVYTETTSRDRPGAM